MFKQIKNYSYIYGPQKIVKRFPIAIHGIQRSGTNYLEILLEKRFNLSILNKNIEERGDSKHKHCRYYKNKKNIPHFISKQYGNNFEVNNIFDINKVCNYKSDVRHLVIFKPINESIFSLVNFGIRVDWFKKEDAINSMKLLIEDYKSYYAFWEHVSNKNKDLVQLINYKDLVKDVNNLTAKLNYMGYKFGNMKNFKIETVPVSPKNRKIFYEQSEIDLYMIDLLN